MRDFRDAKAMARTLREALAAKGRTITHSEALETTAKMLGARDWNTLAAAVEAARGRDAAWKRLEDAHVKGEAVAGLILARVRGGFSVDLDGAPAFLPGSQLDARPVRDLGALIGARPQLAILAMDRPAGHIVVSRRAILERAAAGSAAA